MEIDWKKVGLKAGIEIHQRLATKQKLFCRCEAKIWEGNPTGQIVRKQHPVASELGEEDIAAKYEELRDREFIYLIYPNVCEIDIDEAPPLPLNKEALEISLIIARMFNCSIPNEIHVMRKIITDGSTPMSFQRTAVIGLNGYMEFNGKKIEISQISLEEESAGLVKQEGNKVYFRLDRIGIPLIEISTGLLEGFTPKEIQEIAFKIGLMLRLTRKVQRGIGSIRQDLNVSIKNGARVEIKGVQKLEDIAKIIELEVERQLKLNEIREKVRKKGIEKINEKVFEVTEIFEKSESKLIQKILEQKFRIFAFKLPKFSGPLKEKISGEKTFGKELADYAKAFGIKGIIHSDENLEKYKLEKEFEELRKILKASKEDAIVIIGENKNGKVAEFILNKVKRLIENGLEKETRAANKDCTTRFLRPLPGAARLYPETDIPPIPIDKKYLKEIEKKLPKSFEETLKEIEKMGISKEIAILLIKSEFFGLFEKIVQKVKIEPKIVANFFVIKAKDLRRKGIDLEKISDEKFMKIFELIGKKEIAKEAIEEIVEFLAKNENAKVEDAIEKLGLKISEKEIEEIVRRIVSQNRGYLKEKVFGLVMKELRGKADVQKIRKIFEKVWHSKS
ncbi:MAG: Glu-tRNA(Gln) amidotransferase GatDE subunit E [Candidatus Aenigmarchaeota archaeon ex4484_224]|nr:MAG: Glu-tRNA(Gln) amidotransferase GatDE subunit E [Candidatus Aenigmarchaeota archaeon ex4484_224]